MPDCGGSEQRLISRPRSVLCLRVPRHARLIIDYLRQRRAKKRGGEFEITQIRDDISGPPIPPETDLGRLGDALEELSALDGALAELVDLHFFGGFSFVEIAALRGVSDRTVQRDWRKARLVLHQKRLRGRPATGDRASASSKGDVAAARWAAGSAFRALSFGLGPAAAPTKEAARLVEELNRR